MSLGCENNSSSTSSSISLPAARAIPADADGSEGAIRFLEDRVKRDPDDFIAINKLTNYYLLRLRETGNVTWLELATRAAANSLKAIPAEQNFEGLSLLAQTEFASHNFTSARDHAEQLTKLERRKGYPYLQLADALIELGDYDGARSALREMEKRGSADAAARTRLARMAALAGDNARAEWLYAEALSFAVEMVPPSRETVAWCRWQLGETAFGGGDYDGAEKHYRDSLTTFPDYYRALAGLGRALAAKGDLNGAIEHYERATRILPDPAMVASLGDLYQIAGRAKEAESQYALCEQMAKISAARGQLYNRQLAIFYADHDLKPDEAYALANREYQARRDVYGADALAWAALKAGKIDEASKTIKEALRRGTQDAKLFYHAGMIARAAGDKTSAHEYLQRALKLSPQFDPRQAPVAKQSLAE
ncbi:MAG TPA: tetratricopeptide repeat protein [Blastocatellia bacterium]|nr:tetratricopeptide repeat protein [Blastocatellia bacterium]